MFNSGLWAVRGKHFQSVTGYGNLSTPAFKAEKIRGTLRVFQTEKKVFMSRYEKGNLKGHCYTSE